jgi:hypothetical protein
MVLIYGENSNFKGARPSIMKVLEERKRTINIFNMPLKEIVEESKNIVEEKTPIITDAEVKEMFGTTR